MKVTERMLEDFICTYPNAFWKDAEIIGRQVRLPHGILDLLIFGHEYGRTLIVELKAREIQPKDVGQILRYTYDVVEELLWRRREMWANLPDDDCIDTLHDRLYREAAGDMYGSYERVTSILVGPSISDCACAAAQATAGIQVALWYYEDDYFHFDRIPNEPECYHTRPSWSEIISERIEGFARQESEQEFDATINELFVNNMPRS